jgi:hypothetical protein
LFIGQLHRYGMIGTCGRGEEAGGQWQYQKKSFHVISSYGGVIGSKRLYQSQRRGRGQADLSAVSWILMETPGNSSKLKHKSSGDNACLNILAFYPGY